MFDLAAEPIVWIPVKWGGVKQPEGEGAIAVECEHEVEVLVVVHNRDELRAIFPEHLTDNPDDYEKMPEIDRFKKAARDWRKIVDKGSPVPFGDDAIPRVLNVVGFASAFTAAYLSACVGKIEIKTKN